MASRDVGVPEPASLPSGPSASTLGARAQPTSLEPHAVAARDGAERRVPSRQPCSDLLVLVLQTRELVFEHNDLGAFALKQPGPDPPAAEVFVTGDEDPASGGAPARDVLVGDVALASVSCGVTGERAYVHNGVADEREGVRHLVAQVGVEAVPGYLMLRRRSS